MVTIGKQFEVNGNKMTIYIEGEGEQTIVFLAGGGTSSPILDFKSLYSLLSDDYRIAVVEKVGYGFSDVADVDRSLPRILEDTRTALQLADVQKPYILSPHSMSGIEALYWVQTYPDEVSAIIGLDMAVPATYNDYDAPMAMLYLGKVAADLGVIRWLPGAAESVAIQNGTLTEEEKDLYRTIFYQRTATQPMINEVKSIKTNAKIVAGNGEVDHPMLLFTSNGEGTGWDQKEWVSFQETFASENSKRRLVPLNVSHYVHDLVYDEIALEINQFIKKLELDH